MNAFDVQGLWWLPDHGDHRVPGVLTWDPAHGGSLKLVGQLRPIVLLDNELPDGQVQKYRDRSRDSDKSYPVIHGQAEKTAFTLIDSSQRSKRDWSLDHSSETVNVNSLLEGAFFATSSLEVDRAEISLRDLAEWVNISGLEVDSPVIDGTGEEFIVVRGRRMPNVTIPFKGGHVRLGHSLAGTRHGNVAAGIDQDWSLMIEQGEVKPAQYFLDVAGHLQDLVSIATGRTAEFRDVILQHPDFPQLSISGSLVGNSRQDLAFHARWSNRAERDGTDDKTETPLSAHEMYFTFDHLGADGAGRWFETAEKYKTELGRAIATRYSKGYLEDQIMNVCAALESFDKHRRGLDDEWYVKRVAACVEFAGDTFKDLILNEVQGWAERVRDLRNDLAHHRERFRLDGTVGGNLVAEQIFWLFALCILRAAAAPRPVFENIVKHAQWKWLREQAISTK